MRPSKESIRCSNSTHHSQFSFCYFGLSRKAIIGFDSICVNKEVGLERTSLFKRSQNLVSEDEGKSYNLSRTWDTRTAIEND